MTPETSFQTIASKQPRKGLWWRVLLIVLVFYVVGVLIMLLSNNSNLFPPVIMLGSFMVPAAYVAFFYERGHLSEINLATIALSFFYGGFIGVFAASLLEPLLIQQLTFFSAFEVGLIEEFVKILGVFIIVRGWGRETELEGIILGAVAGMSFAVLENTGYAFSTFLASQGDLATTLWVVFIRGVLSPLGHGTWTAILAGVLFRESTKGRFRIDLKVIGAYLFVVILHGLWDGVPLLISNVTGSGFDVLLVDVVIGTVGLVFLLVRWREGLRMQKADEDALQTAALHVDEAGFPTPPGAEDGTPGPGGAAPAGDENEPHD